MPFPEHPEDLLVQFAFGHNAAEDPTGLSFETVSPASAGDPGPALAPAVITQGRPGNASTTQPTRLALGGLRNDDGEFSPRNPTSPRYGTLLRGTPTRLAVDVGSGVVPPASAAQPDWGPTAQGPDVDRRVSVDALGVLPLLGRADERLSPLTRLGRFWSSHLSFRGWWPCESGSGEVSPVPSGLTGGSTTECTNATAASVTVAATDGLAGATGALEIPTGASIRGSLDAVRNVLAGLWAWEGAIKISSQALEDRIVFYAPNGSRYVAFGTVGTAGVGLTVTSGATTNNLSGTATIADGKWHWLAIVGSAATFGTDPLTIAVYIDGVAVTLTGSVTVTSNEAAQFVVANVDAVSQIMHWRGSYVNGVAYDPFVAYNGIEDAAGRIERLMAEAGYPCDIDGSVSAVMGPQQAAGLMDLLREAEATDEGMLIELRDGRVSYLCRSVLENQTDPWTLSFNDIAGIWPDYSDQFVRNIITARSPDGLTATVEAEGELGPDSSTGIGRRPSPVDRNPYQPASNLIHNAGYALARATQSKPRFHIGINLHGEPQLAQEWLDRFIGSRVVVTDLDEQSQQDLGPGDADGIIVGGEQYLDAGVWALDLMCEPYELFDVGVYAQDLPINDFAPELVGWRDYDTCVLASGVTSTSTSWSVACSPADSSAANDFPRRHYIGGELVTVTASTGGTSPTWTVTRSVNGVVKAHSSAAEITLADPLILTL